MNFEYENNIKDLNYFLYYKKNLEVKTKNEFSLQITHFLIKYLEKSLFKRTFFFITKFLDKKVLKIFFY